MHSFLVPAKVTSFGGTMEAEWQTDVVLGCEVVGYPSPEVNWSRDGYMLQPTSGILLHGNGSLVLYNVNDSLQGTYTCSAKNTHGADAITYNLKIQGNGQNRAHA